MKRKKFTKIISMLLVMSMLLTFGTIIAYAEDESNTVQDPWKSVITNKDISDVDNLTDYYTDTRLKYVGYYKNTVGSLEPYYKAGINELEKGKCTNNDEGGEYKTYNVPDGTYAMWNYNYNSMGAKKLQVNYHFCFAVAFTADKTGTYRFTYQTVQESNSDNGSYQLLIGQNFVATGHESHVNSALKLETFAEVGTLSENTCVYELSEGETLYFMINNPGNVGYASFWLKNVDIFNESATSWYYGDMNEFVGFVRDSKLSYVHYYQGTDPSVDNTAYPAGIYNMTKDTLDGGWDAYVVGEVDSPDPSAPYYVKNMYVSRCGEIKTFYHFALGLAFTAPYTGTMKFTVQTKIGNAEHNLVVGRSTVAMVVDNTNSSGVIYRGLNGSVSSDEVGALTERTLTVDVTAGEKIYFLMDNMGNAGVSQLHLKSAEYVYGDLNENPVTFVAAQETKAYTNGSVQAFDVRLISAVSKNTDTTKNVGFKYSLTINEKTAAENKSYTMSETFKKLTANTDKGIEEISAPQGTSFMAGVLTLPASGTVVITVTSWAETADGTYNDTACQITYTDGAFVKMENINA